MTFGGVAGAGSFAERTTGGAVGLISYHIQTKLCAIWRIWYLEENFGGGGGLFCGTMVYDLLVVLVGLDMLSLLTGASSEVCVCGVVDIDMGPSPEGVRRGGAASPWFIVTRAYMS